MLGELASGFIGNLIWAGLARIGPAAFQKGLRLRRIDHALRGVKSENPVIRTAINDFEIVVGSRYGELTVELKALLDELTASGISGLIVEHALLGRRDDSCRALFLALHRRVIGDANSGGEELYEKLYAAVKVTVEETFSDKVLLQFLRASRGELSARLDTIQERILDIASSLKDPRLTHEELARVAARIATAQRSNFRHLRIETNRGVRNVDISKIYTPSRILQQNIPPNQTSMLRVRVAAKARLSAGRPLRRVHPLFNLIEFRTLFRRAVVLGDPGGGKSTLCQMLCYDLAKQVCLHLAYSDSRELDPRLRKTPLRVILRFFEAARQTSPQLDLFTYICNDLAGSVPEDREKIAATTKHLLESGRALIAFDGLDEILNIGRRREFVDLVVAFSNQYPLCPVLVTSRRVGYAEARLPADFDEFHLQRFDQHEVREYVLKFMRSVSNRTPKDAQQKADEFLHQTNRDASDLRQNPLMLGLMTSLFEMKGDVPTNRPEIYKECATLLFEKWDAKRDILADIPGTFYLLDMFSHLAEQMFLHAEPENQINEEWLIEKLKSYFSGQYLDPIKVGQVAKKLVDFVTGRAWVLSDVGAGVYQFTHRTFLEYFFARSLVGKFDTVRNLFKHLRSKIIRGEWDVVCHLALQLKTDGSQRRISEVLRCNTDLVSEQKKPDFLIKSMNFSAGSLSYLAGPEKDIEALTKQILSSTFGLAQLGNFQGSNAIFICLDRAKDRQDIVVSTISERIVREISSRSQSDSGFALALIGSSIFVESFHAEGENSIETVPLHIAHQIQKQSKGLLIERALSDRRYSRLCIEWYEDSTAALLEKYGLSALVDDIRPIGDGSSYEPFSGLIAAIFEEDEKREPIAIKVMEALGQYAIGQEHLSCELDLQKLTLADLGPFELEDVGGRLKENHFAVCGLALCIAVLKEVQETGVKMLDERPSQPWGTGLLFERFDRLERIIWKNWKHDLGPLSLWRKGQRSCLTIKVTTKVTLRSQRNLAEFNHNI